VDRLIDENTLLPFYMPFVPSERLSLLREDMRSDRGGSIYGRLGILTSKIDLEFIRFCPICVEADRDECRETYWHRLHNLPGVEVCSQHNVFLEQSSVHFRDRGRGKRDEFVTAEQIVCVVPPRHLDEANPQHQAYLQVAKDAAWLLAQRGLTSAPTMNRERYFELLKDKGLSTYANTVNTCEVISSLNEYYSPELLDRLGCGTERSYNWVHRLVHNTKKAQHPLHHLLLMQFLGCSAERFFHQSVKHLPFGEGPWPCLNRASDHYGQNTITECKLALTYKRNENSQRIPRGTFRCDCGFAYYRHGPDKSVEARFKLHGYVTFGEAWENTLRKMHAEGTSYRKMAAHLSIAPRTVKSQIAQLGLATTSGIEISIQHVESHRGRGRLKSANNPDQREANRKVLLSTISANPDLGRSAIKLKIMFAFNWLYKNDQEWLEAHLPPRLAVKGPGVQVDWQARDAEIAASVRSEASRIMNALGRPIRVSMTGVAKRISKVTLINKHGDKLPLTIRALYEVAESVEDYAVRRVRWAAEVYRLQGFSASRWQIQAKAAVSNKVAKLPTVKSTIETAALRLELHNSI
jgi:hypothetical protein